MNTSPSQPKVHSAGSSNVPDTESGGASPAFYFFIGTLVLSLLTMLAALVFV